MSLGIPLLNKHGWGLLVPILVLCLFGVLTIQVVSSSASPNTLAGAAKNQLIYIAVSFAMMMLAVFVGYQRVGRLSYLLFVLCLVLLMVLLLGRWLPESFIPVVRGSRRWIRLHPSLPQMQPSELMKIAYVLALAWYLRFRKNYRTLRGLIPPFVLSLIPMAMILKQPDLGTVLLFLPVLFAMLYAAGAKGKHLVTIILLGVLCAPLFWLKIKDYQRLRLAGVFLQNQAVRDYLSEPPRFLKSHPTRWDCFRPKGVQESNWRLELDEWHLRSGYQLSRSKTAIGLGGVRGQGWGKGLFVRLGYLLDESNNDFIFSMIAHQWGLMGSLIIVLCYVVIVMIGYDVAASTYDPFGRLVAVGLATMIGVQSLTNLCMTVGLGPITGVTLPFVSEGGSSMLASFVTIGLLISVARHRPMLIGHRPFEFNEEAEKYETVM